MQSQPQNICDEAKSGGRKASLTVKYIDIGIDLRMN